MRNLYPGATGPVGAPPVPNSHHSRAAAAAAAAGYTHYSHANNLSHMSRYPQVGKEEFFFSERIIRIIGPKTSLVNVFIQNSNGIALKSLAFTTRFSVLARYCFT